MGRKVNPIAIRMGINKGWNATWYSEKKNFPKTFAQDIKIEAKIRETMRDAGIDRVEINRFANKSSHQLFAEPEGWNTTEYYFESDFSYPTSSHAGYLP